MRLAIDATAVGNRISGIERYAFEVACHLLEYGEQRGWDVRLLIHKDSRERWAETIADAGAKILVSPWRSKLLTQQIWIPYILVKQRFNTAYFPGFPPSPLAFLIPNLKVVRTIFDGVMWAAPETISLKNRLYFRPLENFGSRRYALVHTISHNAKDEISKFLPYLQSKIFVSGCGVTIADQADARGASEVGATGEYLLFVGTLEPRKNIPFLLSAFSKVLSAHPQIKLVLAGRRGWGADAVDRQIVALGLSDNVVMTGPITDEVLSAIYSRATALVFPSFYEGFGLPVVEAMQKRVPVICSNTSSLPEVGGDAAILLPPDDQAAWVDAMCNVIKNPKLRSDMIAKGLEHAKMFQWNAVAARIGVTL